MEEIISLLIPVAFVAALVLERLFPARALPRVHRWVLKGFAFFVVTALINALLPAFIAPKLAAFSIVSVEKLGLLPAAIITLLVTELFSYTAHRSMHRFPWLWRWTHQMHHSAERLDVAGAVMFHPFDISLQVFASVLAASLVGSGGDAAAISGFVIFLCAMFQHLNVRTPHWLGYLVQRPEGHSVHHQRGLHAYNYGNFAIMDQIFGTYRNPKDFAPQQGFWDGASSKVGSMLIGRDIADPKPSASDPSLVPAE